MQTLTTDQYRKTNCRYCKEVLPAPFLDLGYSPLANSFLPKEERGEEFKCPLSLARCPRCGLIHLSHVVPPDLMFAHYLYVSSTTQTFKKHFAEYAKSAKKRLQKKEDVLAVDVGSNDGLLLSCYRDEGMRIVGVDPAKNLAEEANEKGLTTLCDYFGEKSVQTILKNHGKADIISANNVFAHIDDIHNVLTSVNQLLSEKGILIIEFPYLVTMIEEMLFDMVYHEHLSYIAINPLQTVLNDFKLEIFAIEEVASHGGSLRVFIQKQGAGYTISKEVGKFKSEEIKKGYMDQAIYNEFSKRVAQVKEKLTQFVQDAKSKGKTIAGYGAPAKSTTIISFCGFNPSQISYIVDDNPLKQNRLSPGARIPIVSSQALKENPTDYIIIFAWNFAEEIVKKLEPLRKKGVKFIVPLPEPRII